MPNKLEQAQEALAKVEAHMETLTPQTQARHMAERVRDNLAACIAMAQCNPKAGEILMPNVLTAAHEYLSGLGNVHKAGGHQHGIAAVGGNAPYQ